MVVGGPVLELLAPLEPPKTLTLHQTTAPKARHSMVCSAKRRTCGLVPSAKQGLLSSSKPHRETDPREPTRPSKNRPKSRGSVLANRPKDSSNRLLQEGPSGQPAISKLRGKHCSGILWALSRFCELMQWVHHAQRSGRLPICHLAGLGRSPKIPRGTTLFWFDRRLIKQVIWAVGFRAKLL